MSTIEELSACASSISKVVEIMQSTISKSAIRVKSNFLEVPWITWWEV